VARRGELEIHTGAEEGIGDLYQDAGTVAGLGIGTDGTSMRQALQNLETLLDDPMALLVLDVADEANAAGVALVGGIVQALCGWVGTKVHQRTSL
jgi:hypothetical protein